MKKTVCTTAILFLTLLMVSCSSDGVAGTGSDVNSGTISAAISGDLVSISGANFESVDVLLFNKDELNQDSSSEYVDMVTSTDGTYFFDSLESGSYRIEVVTDLVTIGVNENILVDSVGISVSTVDIYKISSGSLNDLIANSGLDIVGIEITYGYVDSSNSADPLFAIPDMDSQKVEIKIIQNGEIFYKTGTLIKDENGEWRVEIEVENILNDSDSLNIADSIGFDKALFNSMKILFEASNLLSYRYSYEESGAFILLPTVITITDGVYFDVEGKPQPYQESFKEDYGLQKLFTVVENAYKNAVENWGREDDAYINGINITYNEEYGFPTALQVSYYEPEGMDLDATTSWTISNFELLGGSVIIEETDLGSRYGDSLALVALQEASLENNWDYTTPIDTWRGVHAGSGDSDRVTGLNDGPMMTIQTLPKEIGNLTKIEYLGLYEDSYTTLPAEFGNLVSLKTLYLSPGELKELPAEFSKLLSLESIYFRGQKFTEFPAVLGSLPNLISVNFENNKLTSLNSLTGTFPKLEKLNLNENSITSLTEQSCSSLKGLKELILSSNSVTSLPQEFGLLTSLTTLKLESNQLTSLPQEFSLLTSLISLNLDSNQLDVFPDPIAGCVNLTHINLDYNSIPEVTDAIGELVNVERLYLRDNKLSKISSRITQLTKLNSITLQNNALQFGDLEYLKDVPSFTSAPQDTIGNPVSLTGETAVVLKVDVSGLNNSYMWFRNGQRLYFDNTSELVAIRSGVYTCKIFNSVLEGYHEYSSGNLYHHPFTVTIEDIIPPELTNSPTLIVQPSEQGAIIKEDLIVYSDNVTPMDDITITITSLPTNGTLKNYDRTIDVGFRTSNIPLTDGAFLNYSHNGGGGDSFKFTLTDYEGNVSEEYTCLVEVEVL
jgi:hypothetical protein